MRAITCAQLIRLLLLDGWVVRRKAPHGLLLLKRFPGEAFPRNTTVPDKGSQIIVGSTLGAILGVKQTSLGQDGLEVLIRRFGLNS